MALLNYLCKMKFLTSMLITFMIFENFELVKCFKISDSDRRLEEEVMNYASYLKHKQGKKSSSGSHFDPLTNFADSTSDSSLREISEHGKKQKTHKFIKDLAHNMPKKEEIIQNYGKILSPKNLVHSAIFPNLEKSLIIAPDEKHYGLEEIVYIRRSESDLNDPIPEMIEKLVQKNPSKNPSHNIHEHATDIYDLPAGDDPNALSSSDSECPVINTVSYADHTCSDGPEYEIEFHPAFDEALKRQMENMLPESNVEGSRCDPRRRLGPETLVKDRALCPYQLNISNHNPSRIPKDLYEAKCSCQGWRRPGEEKLFNCAEVKKAIPVLWLASCENGIKKYKQGWDEIAVACVPDIELSSDSFNVESMN